MQGGSFWSPCLRHIIPDGISSTVAVLNLFACWWLQIACHHLFLELRASPCYACMLSRFSHVWLFMTSWALYARFHCPCGVSRQEYWSGLPCPSPGDLPNPGIKPVSPGSPALASGIFTTSATWEAPRTSPLKCLIDFKLNMTKYALFIFSQRYSFNAPVLVN